MAPDAVDGDPEQLGIVAAKLVRQLVEQRELVATDWAPVIGIEHEYHRTSAERGQLHRLAGTGVQREIGGGRSGLEQRRWCIGGRIGGSAIHHDLCPGSSGLTADHRSDGVSAKSSPISQLASYIG